jgi:hypothetical protein
MAYDEKLHGGLDKKHEITAAERKKQRKERIKNKREKYNISPEVSDTQIAEKENQLTEVIHQNVAEVESEVLPAEGNIAEKLLTAAESGNDGDIQIAMASAHHYHQTSNAKILQRLTSQRDHKVTKLFSA